MRISDQFVVQEVGPGQVVVVDDVTGSEELVPIDQGSIVEWNARFTAHEVGEPYRLGSIEIPPKLLFSFGLALGYFYAHDAHAIRT